MKPLHLNILLHYYSSIEDYDQIPSNKCRTDYAYQLAELGYLYTPQISNQIFFITKHGRDMVQKLLSVLSEEKTV